MISVEDFASEAFTQLENDQNEVLVGMAGFHTNLTGGPGSSGAI